MSAETPQESEGVQVNIPAGIVLEVLGLAFLLIGMVGAIRKILTTPRLVTGQSWISDLTGLINALAQAPVYVVPLLVGLLLFYWAGKLL